MPSRTAPRHRTALIVDEAVLGRLAADGYKAPYAARFLQRTIERAVATAIADCAGTRRHATFRATVAGTT